MLLHQIAKLFLQNLDCGVQKYLKNYLKPKKWTYLREHSQMMQSGSTKQLFQNKYCYKKA